MESIPIDNEQIVPLSFNRATEFIISLVNV